MVDHQSRCHCYPLGEGNDAIKRPLDGNEALQICECLSATLHIVAPKVGEIVVFGGEEAFDFFVPSSAPPSNQSSEADAPDDIESLTAPSANSY